MVDGDRETSREPMEPRSPLEKSGPLRATGSGTGAGAPRWQPSYHGGPPAADETPVTDIVEEPPAEPAEEPAVASPAPTQAPAQVQAQGQVDDGPATETFYPGVEGAAESASAGSVTREDVGDDAVTETFPTTGKILGAGGLFTAASSLAGRRPSPRPRDAQDADVTEEGPDGPASESPRATEMRLKDFLGSADEHPEPVASRSDREPVEEEEGGRSFGGRKLVLAAMALVVAASGAGLLVNRMQAVTVAPTGESDDTSATQAGKAHSAIENPTPEYVPPVPAVPGAPTGPAGLSAPGAQEPPGEPAAPLPSAGGAQALPATPHGLDAPAPANSGHEGRLAAPAAPAAPAPAAPAPAKPGPGGTPAAPVKPGLEGTLAAPAVPAPVKPGPAVTPASPGPAVTPVSPAKPGTGGALAAPAPAGVPGMFGPMSTKPAAPRGASGPGFEQAGVHSPSSVSPAVSGSSGPTPSRGRSIGRPAHHGPSDGGGSRDSGGPGGSGGSGGAGYEDYTPRQMSGNGGLLGGLVGGVLN